MTTKVPARLAGLLQRLKGEEPTTSKHERPEVKESWEKDFNPVMDATPVVRFGAVFVRPNRYFDAASGHFLDANAALIAKESCEICGTDFDERGRISGPDYRYMVRVLRPEHLFATKPVYEWTWCRRCLTPEDVEAQRQDVFEGMPAPMPPNRRRKR